MKPIFLGFCLKPFALIIWKRDGKPISKTVCYDEQEVVNALSRKETSNYYKNLEPNIHYSDEL